jgi:hypothetical protein
VNGRWIRLPLFDPEERPLSITKSPQIRMIAFTLVGQEELDVKRLQGRLIERQRTFDMLTVRMMSGLPKSSHRNDFGIRLPHEAGARASVNVRTT